MKVLIITVDRKKTKEKRENKSVTQQALKHRIGEKRVAIRHVSLYINIM